MDANEFYTRKEDLLERLTNALSEAREAALLLKVLEKKADEPDEWFLGEVSGMHEELESFDDYIAGEYSGVSAMAESARQATKK